VAEGHWDKGVGLRAAGVTEELHAVKGDGLEGGAGVSGCPGRLAAALGGGNGCVVQLRSGGRPPHSLPLLLAVTRRGCQPQQCQRR
jgi:hypothetical protein